MTINPEAFRLKDLMAPVVGVPTPGHPPLQAAGRTRLNGLEKPCSLAHDLS